MINVYISKSNEASIDDLLYVRTVVKKYPDLKILEHTGGTYNSSLVEKAACIIVIPDLKSPQPMLVGKGIFGEAMTESCKHTMIFVGENYVQKLVRGDVKDATDWKKYGLLRTDGLNYGLDYLCETVLKANGFQVRIQGEHKGHDVEHTTVKRPSKDQEGQEKAAMHLAKHSTYGAKYNHLIED